MYLYVQVSLKKGRIVSFFAKITEEQETYSLHIWYTGQFKKSSALNYLHP